MLVSGMAGPMGQLKAGTPPDLLHKQSYEYAKAAGMELWGKHAWYADSTRPRLEDYMRDIAVEDPRLIGSNLNALVDERIKAFTDKSVKDVLVLRAADSQGRANFVVHAYTEDGMLRPTTFTTDDLKARITKDRQERIARRAPGTKQADQGPVDVTQPFVGFPRP